MAEPRWIKMDVDMYRHPKLILIDSMEDSNLIYYVWTSSILLAGECNMGGELYLSTNMPYSIKSLSVVIRRSEEEVKKAYDVLMSLGMIEMTEDGVYKIYNWEKHQNVEGLDKIRKQTNERVARYRERKREEKKKAGAGSKEDSRVCEEENCEISSSLEENNNVSSSEKNDYENNRDSEDDYGNMICEEGSAEGRNRSEFGSIDRVNTGNEPCSNDFDKDNIDDFEKCNYEEQHGINPKENIVMDSNVTYKNTVTSCNVTETQEKKNKNKDNKSIEKERDRHGVSHSHNKKLLKDDSHKENKNISVSSFELMEYCENITGVVSPLDVRSLNLAINMHGKDNVKKAIDKSIECGRVTMPYINGILKNWRKEGYPVDESSEDYKFKSIKGKGKEGKGYGSNSNDKGDGADFKEFKVIIPEGPRLTDEEREKLCANLI